jgi:sec-independent protein translocase protein TatB
MLGLSFDKLIVIGFIAVALIGPKRLPFYASQLAKWTKAARDLANGAKTRVAAELGPEFEEIDWKKFDPRQYDPRRIVLSALSADSEPDPAAAQRPLLAEAPESQEPDPAVPDDTAGPVTDTTPGAVLHGGPPRSVVVRKRPPSPNIPIDETSDSPAESKET